MSKEDMTTRHLEEILKQIDSQPQLEAYLETPGTVSPYETFREYYLSLPKVQAIPRTKLYELADIERSYCYHILSGSKIPGRDKILRLCIAAKLDQQETRQALESGGAAPLYARNKRDAVISFAINNGCTVLETNELLHDMNLEVLQ